MAARGGGSGRKRTPMDQGVRAHNGVSGIVVPGSQAGAIRAVRIAAAGDLGIAMMGPRSTALDSITTLLDTLRLTANRENTGRTPRGEAVQLHGCPCGGCDDVIGPLNCTRQSMERHRTDTLGPHGDAIDLIAWVRAPTAGARTNVDIGAAEDDIRRARERQVARQGQANGTLDHDEARRHAALSEGAKQLLDRWAGRFAREKRPGHETWAATAIRIARTAADLDNEDTIGALTMANALSIGRWTASPWW